MQHRFRVSYYLAEKNFQVRQSPIRTTAVERVGRKILLQAELLKLKHVTWIGMLSRDDRKIQSADNQDSLKKHELLRSVLKWLKRKGSVAVHDLRILKGRFIRVTRPDHGSMTHMQGPKGRSTRVPWSPPSCTVWSPDLWQHPYKRSTLTGSLPSIFLLRKGWKCDVSKQLGLVGIAASCALSTREIPSEI